MLGAYSKTVAARSSINFDCYKIQVRVAGHLMRLAVINDGVINERSELEQNTAVILDKKRECEGGNKSMPLTDNETCLENRMSVQMRNVYRCSTHSRDFRKGSFCSFLIWRLSGSLTMAFLKV
jgi:hypothetical protein